MNVPAPAPIGRIATATGILAAAAALVAFDLATSEPINPYAAAPPLAFASGEAAGGAHCAAPTAPAPE